VVDRVVAFGNGVCCFEPRADDVDVFERMNEGRRKMAELEMIALHVANAGGPEQYFSRAICQQSGVKLSEK